MRDALTIAAELRAEALRLMALGNEYLTLAMLCEGTHYSLPDDVRATEEERLERMTPEQRERFDEMERRWAERQSRRAVYTPQIEGSADSAGQEQPDGAES